MDRFQGSEKARTTPLATPLTDASRFTITKLDVGSEAVRPGLAADLEVERNLLLAAAKVALAHIRAGKVPIGAVHEFLLENAIRLAETPK